MVSTWMTRNIILATAEMMVVNWDREWRKKRMYKRRKKKKNSTYNFKHVEFEIPAVYRYRSKLPKTQFNHDMTSLFKNLQEFVTVDQICISLSWNLRSSTIWPLLAFQNDLTSFPFTKHLLFISWACVRQSHLLSHSFHLECTPSPAYRWKSHPCFKTQLK